MLTLNQIISQITTLGTAHSQIAEVGVGTFAELQASERNYPLLWVFYEQSNIEDGYFVNNIRLSVMDRVITGEEGDDTQYMEQEVLSDTLYTLVDFYAYFDQQHAQEYVIEKTDSFVPFTEAFNDRVAGNTVTLSIKQFYDFNKCQIPESGAAIPPSIDGLTLYDFCDGAVQGRLTSAQVTCLQDWLCTPCADATIQVNGTDIGVVASGGIHNQRIHDSGGHNVGTAADPSVIGDATIQNDAIAPTWSDTVEAEGQYVVAQGKALDSDGATTLLADYIPAANGFMFTCTPATGGPSVIVTTSDATPDYGDIVTITLTPTGMTPTAYVFYLPQCDGTYAKVTQGTNTYAWTVGTVGNVTVYGGCTDGTDTAYDVDGIAVNIPDGIGSISTPYGCCSVILQYPAYAGALVKIRRSSDNAEKDFYPDGSDELSLTSEDGAGTSLTTWIGANSGYVTTFYDQSGNARHGVQTTASAQPRIVNAGALETLNGKAAIYFDGVDDGMEWSAFGGLAYVDIYTVMGLPDNPYILFTDGSKYAYIAQSGSGTTSVENSWLSKPLLTNGVPRQWINRGEVYDAFAIATQIQFYAKGAVTSAWSNFRMLNHAGWYGEGYIQQMAVFNANSEAVTDIITASVNSNFNVY